MRGSQQKHGDIIILSKSEIQLVLFVPGKSRLLSAVSAVVEVEVESPCVVALEACVFAAGVNSSFEDPIARPPIPPTSKPTMSPPTPIAAIGGVLLLGDGF